MNLDRMIAEQIVARGIGDRRVIEAVRSVPRDYFVPDDMQDQAYADRALPSAAGQTISQPYVVARMTEALDLSDADSVLEIGTGTGYQTAILARLAGKVHTIEIIPRLASEARRRLAALGCENVAGRVGDGYDGWPDAAPFDRIVVTAAPKTTPDALLAQLRVGGRMVIPVGDWDQQLIQIDRLPDGTRTTTLMPVRFVPMVRAKSITGGEA